MNSRISNLFKKQGRAVGQIVEIVAVLTPVKGPVESVILQDGIVSCIAKGFKAGFLLGAHPFEWDDLSNRPKLDGKCSKTRKFIWITNIVLCMVYYFFLIVQYFRYQLNENATQFSQIYTIFMLCFYAILPCNHIAIVWKGHLIPTFVTSCMQCIEEHERRYLLPNSVPPTIIKIETLFLFGIFYVFWTCGIVAVIYFVTNPMSPDLLSSVYFEHDQVLSSSFWGTPKTLVDLTVIVLALIFHFYVGLHFGYTCFFLIYSAVPGTFMGIVAINEMSVKTSKVTSSEMLTSWSAKLKFYRQVWLLFNEAQNIFGFCLSYNKNLLQTSTVLCVNGFIRYTGFISLAVGFLGLTLFVYISGVLYSIAMVNSRTCALLKEWKAEVGLEGANKDKFVSMTLASLTPIKLHIGSSFIDKRMIPSMYHTIFKSVVRTLQIKPKAP